MSPPIPARATQFARAAALLLTLGLFTIGSAPAAGQTFPGMLHWIVHLAAYSAIALAFGFGWPLWSAVAVAALVAAIGAIHETSEIITHSHPFESLDVLVNAAGAVLGVTMQRAVLWISSRRRS